VTSLPRAAAPGPCGGAFVALGMFWGTWAVSAADIQRSFHLSYGALGVLLAVAIALAALTGTFAGHFAERFGTARMLSASLSVWGVLLAATASARSFALFATLLVATEVAGGCVDTAMNAAASVRLIGQPGALVRFHALFNSGALGGAAIAAGLLHASVSWRWVWPLLSAVALATALWTRLSSGDEFPGDLERTGPPTRAIDTFSRLRSEGLLVFLAIFAMAELTEGGVDLWGVLFLRRQLGAGVLLGAGGYIVGQAVATATRGAFGPMLGRLQARKALIVGASIAGGGILLEAVSPHPIVAALGLALGAGGASLFWPLAMSDVTKRASKPTAAIGAFTGAGYVGWVAGAPLVGWVADGHGLGWGLVALAILAGAVATLSFLSLPRRTAAVVRD
jgi:MFS family permease